MGTVRVDIEKLYEAVEDRRKETGDSLIDVGVVSGVQRRVMTKLRAAGLRRIDEKTGRPAEYRPSADVLLSLCEWLDTDPRTFGAPNEDAGELAVQTGWRPHWENYDDCPTCKVGQGMRCVRILGTAKGEPMLYPHPRRRRLAASTEQRISAGLAEAAPAAVS